MSCSDWASTDAARGKHKVARRERPAKARLSLAMSRPNRWQGRRCVSLRVSDHPRRHSDLVDNDEAARLGLATGATGAGRTHSTVSAVGAL